MKLVGYIRISSESQSENTSLDEQRRKIENYCQLYDHELIAVFGEVASGKTAKDRPQFLQALDLLRTSGDAIISTKLDRIARNIRDLLDLVHETLLPNNKALVLLDQQVDTSTPTGRVLLGFMGLIADLERDTINERTQGGRKAKSANGGYAYGSPKYGESAINRELVANPDELAVIEVIRRHHKSGKSLRAIADYLNINGYKSKRGSKWQHTSVKNVIDRIYS